MYNQYQFPNFYQSTGYPQTTQNKYEVIRVNGENGARALQMAPNSNVLLLDNTAPIVWLVQTDGAGYKTLTPYNISPLHPEPQVDVKSLEGRISRIEEIINVKPDTKNAESE